MRTRTLTIAMLTAVALASTPAFGQGRGNGKEKGMGKAKENKIERAHNRDDDVRIVHEYFVNTSNLPPGLAKRQTLPPGLEGQLVVKGKLPPGLAKKMQPVPVILTRQLVILPSTQRRVIIGNQLVVLDRTNHILDFFALP